MHRQFLIALAIVCLAGCSSQPARVAESRSSKPAATSKPAAPASAVSGGQFSGQVGQLEQGSKFVEFITKHENHAVMLDVQLPADGFEGGKDGDASFFVVWDECDNLPDGQKPNNSYCTGFEYHIPGAGALAQEPGGWRLRGRFRAVNAGGPLQGLMSVQLQPGQAGAQ